MTVTTDYCDIAVERDKRLYAELVKPIQDILRFLHCTDGVNLYSKFAFDDCPHICGAVKLEVEQIVERNKRRGDPRPIDQLYKNAEEGLRIELLLSQGMEVPRNTNQATYGHHYTDLLFPNFSPNIKLITGNGRFQLFQTIHNLKEQFDSNTKNSADGIIWIRRNRDDGGLSFGAAVSAHSMMRRLNHPGRIPTANPRVLESDELFRDPFSLFYWPNGRLDDRRILIDILTGANRRWLENYEN